MALSFLHRSDNTRAAQQAQRSSAAPRESIPLRQMPARSRLDAGGTLQQDGPESQPADALQQQAADPRQRSGAFGSLRQGLSRLREKLHHDGNKLKKAPSGNPRAGGSRPGGLPTRPDDDLNTGQFTRPVRNAGAGETDNAQDFTRSSARDRRPGTAGRDDQNFTRNSGRDKQPGEATRDPRPPVPPKNPLRNAAQQTTTQSAPRNNTPSPPAKSPLRNQNNDPLLKNRPDGRLADIAEEPEEESLSTAEDGGKLAIPQKSPLRQPYPKPLFSDRPNPRQGTSALPGETPALSETAQGKQKASDDQPETPQPQTNGMRRRLPSNYANLSDKARGKLPEGLAPADPGDDPTPPPREAPPSPRPASVASSLYAMETIPEEKHAELEESKLSTMQQRALRAAEADTAERKNVLRPQVATLALDDKGKLSVTESVSDNLRNILNETVARPRHTYQAHQANDGNSQHLLMDTNGRLLSLQGSKTAFIGLTQSVPMRGWKQEEQSATSQLLDRTGLRRGSTPAVAQIRFRQDGSASISATGRPNNTDDDELNRTVALPGAPIHARLTGIYSHERDVGESDAPVKDIVEENVREHNGRLYRLDEAGLHWNQIDKDEEKSFGKLTKQADGMLYAIRDKNSLHNLSTGKKSEEFKEKITNYTLNSRGEALLLLSDKKTTKQSVKLLANLETKKDQQQSIALKLAGADGADASDFHATAITLHDDKLFAVGSNGKLYSADAPGGEDKEVVLQEDTARTTQLRQHLGEKFAVEEFLNHGNGQLLALVKDTSNQRHACLMGANGELRPEWNLSESLVMDHHEGLLRPRPLAHETVDLGRLGQVLLNDGKVQAFNKNSQRWEASFENADSMKRGQDGQAYVIKDGIASRVKISLKSDSIGGVNNQFVMRQMKSNLSLDLPLVGLNADNKAKAIAPLDAERFVALTEKGELQFHRNLPGSRQPDKMMRTLTKDGIANHLPHMMPGSVRLPPSGEGNTLTDVAMDHRQSLYVLDEQGKLFSLPKEHWQQSQNQSPTPGWQPVDLPDSLAKIESLHNAPDGSLVVADVDGRSAILQLAGSRLNAKVKETNGERVATPPASLDAHNRQPSDVPANPDPLADAPRGEQSRSALQRELSPGVVSNTSTSTTSSSNTQQVSKQAAKQVAEQNRWLMQPDYDPNKKIEAKSHRRKMQQAWERLDETTKSTRVMGMTMKREINLLGMTGRDGNHINSRLRDRLRAHLFRPDFSTPRPAKTVGYGVQHRWQGREGLRPLYEHQAALHNAMRTLTAEPDHQYRLSAMQKLDQIDDRAFNKEFTETLRNFIHGVTDSALHHSSLIGMQAGAMKADRTPVENFTPSRITAMSQAININSDDRNLIADLANLYNRYPMRAENDSQQMMQSLDTQGVTLHHQKEQPPLGRKRDPFDDLSLSKSRLILDGLTMHKLHEMVDEMQQLATSPDATLTQKQDLQERFRVLRDETYGEDAVRKATSYGFVSHKQLEACYDSIKSMTKAFSKPDHGLHMTTRTVLKAKDMTVPEMTERLHRTITSLEPGENMGFSRNYGALAALSVIPGGEIIGIPGVRGSLDRAYNLSFSRGDTGINVSFSRNGGGTGMAFGAVGWNPLTLSDDYQDIKVDLGEHRKMTPSARLGGMVSLALQNQMQNSISFSLSEAELKPFLDELTAGTIEPQKMLDKGVNHRVKNGTTLTFNVDAALSAVAGGGVTIPVGPENNVSIRGNIIAQAGVNVASAQRDRNTTRSDGGVTEGRSNNRLRGLNNASAGVGVLGGLGITATAADNLRVPMFGVSNTNVQISIDNRTKQSMSLDLAKAEPVEQQQFDKLIEQIGLNFDDASLNKLVQDLKDADKPPELPKNKLSDGVKALMEDSLRQQAANPLTSRPMTKKQREEWDKLKEKDAEKADDAAAAAAAATAAGANPDALAITPAGESGNEVADDAPAAKKDDDEEKFSTYQKQPKEALKLKLDKLTTHLLAMEPANNGQYGVINTAKQLKLQQQAADLHCQALNSADYSSTYNNLHKIHSNGLMHSIHSIFASELPPSNAERISSFMDEKPMLKEVIRELEKHSDTQAVVSLELKDNEKYRTQQLWLDHGTQPEDIRKMLTDNNKLRIKSIAFTETNNKPEGINLPVFVTGGSSSASVSMSRNLGKISFSYGENQDKPHSFSLEGEIAYATQDVASALTNAEVMDKRGVV